MSGSAGFDARLAASRLLTSAATALDDHLDGWRDLGAIVAEEDDSDPAD